MKSMPRAFIGARETSRIQLNTFSSVTSKWKKKRCVDCGINWADVPKNICSGCEAYQDHTGHF